MPITSNIGVFIAFLVAAILHFTVVPYVGLIFSLTCLVSLFFIPETPPYLLATKQFDKAEKSSIFYNGGMPVNTEDRDEREGEVKPSFGEESMKITFDDFRELKFHSGR